MEDNFKGIKFCPNCSNMLNATEEEKSLVFKCRYCKHSQDIGENADASELIIVRRQHKRKENRTLNVKDNQYLALDSSMSRC
jgi:DNA-directed RNA polymerase subunit M/transcription elongation factor TFIIS